MEKITNKRNKIEYKYRETVQFNYQLLLYKRIIITNIKTLTIKLIASI